MRDIPQFESFLTTEALNKFVHEYSLAEEKLTKEQFAEAIRQMIAAGDFCRYLIPTKDGMGSTVVYDPYRECERLRSENRRLKDTIETVERLLSGKKDEDEQE